MKSLFPLLLAFIALPAFSQKKTDDRSAALTGIDTLMERILKERKGAGFAVAVVDKNKIYYFA